MSENFGDLKNAVDQLLNANSLIRKKRRSEADKKMELFRQIINSIEEVNNRSFLVNYESGMDMSKYDEKFLEIIDALMYISYGKVCYDLISFYLFERVNQDDGSINPVIIEETGQHVILNNPYELYGLMKSINPKIE